MSLFGALSELTGGAVLVAAPACDLALPATAVVERGTFLAWLGQRNEVSLVRGVVEALGHEIWMGPQTRGLAQRDLEHHVGATANLLAEFPPAPAFLAEIGTTLRSGGAAGANAGEPVSRRIAFDIVRRADAAGRLAQQNLSGDAVLFLIERTFALLVGGEKALLRLGVALADFAAEQGAISESVSDSASLPPGLANLGLSRAFLQRIEAAGGGSYIKQLAEQHGLTERALHRLAALVDSQLPSGEEPMARLEQLVGWLSEVRDQLLSPSNDDPEVRRHKMAAAAALADGDFEIAMDALRHVRRELRETRRRTEERLQEEAIALKGQMLDEAHATARLAELLAARGEHFQAAELFADAAITLPRAEQEAAWQFNLKRADSLLQHARQRDDAGVLAEALVAFGKLVRSAADTTNIKALADACLGHGDALSTAGEREAGTGRLKDAVTIYQKAIELFERAPEPGALVRARLALARALARLGERDGSTQVLRQAADAFRGAATLVTAATSPGEHAILMMGLGSVLLAIEEREGGVPLLNEAADAYRAALGALDPEADTERWGEAQLNLGLALLGLGEQEGSPEQLGQSVKAFRDALEATPRVKVPQRWALTQMNLGNALAALGDRDRTGTALLEEAVAAYTMAIEELNREREPLKWAITQMNLGTALIRLGERKDKRRHWLAAASVLVPALEVFEIEKADTFAEMTRSNLKRFQDSWDSFIGGPATAGRGENPAGRGSKLAG